MTIATPIADMITEMHASGIQLDMIIVAVRSMERALSTRHPVDEVAEKRRAWDREYRRNKREHPPDPPDIHPIPPDVGNNALSLEDKKERSLSVKEERKQESKKERGCKIPPDWKPNEKHYSEGALRGLDRSRVDTLAQDMRIWCGANDNRAVTTKSNWDLTFLGWVRREKSTGKPLTEFQRKQAETNDVRSQLRSMASSGRSGGTPYRILPDDHGERSEDVRSGPGTNLLALPRASGR